MMARQRLPFFSVVVLLFCISAVLGADDDAKSPVNPQATEPPKGQQTMENKVADDGVNAAPSADDDAKPTQPNTNAMGNGSAALCPDPAVAPGTADNGNNSQPVQQADSVKPNDSASDPSGQAVPAQSANQTGKAEPDQPAKSNQAVVPVKNVPRPRPPKMPPTARPDPPQAPTQAPPADPREKVINIDRDPFQNSGSGHAGQHQAQVQGGHSHDHSHGHSHNAGAGAPESESCIAKAGVEVLPLVVVGAMGILGVGFWKVCQMVKFDEQMNSTVHPLARNASHMMHNTVPTGASWSDYGIYAIIAGAVLVILYCCYRYVVKIFKDPGEEDYQPSAKGKSLLKSQAPGAINSQQPPPPTTTSVVTSGIITEPPAQAGAASSKPSKTSMPSKTAKKSRSKSKVAAGGSQIGTITTLSTLKSAQTTVSAGPKA